MIVKVNSWRVDYMCDGITEKLARTYRGEMNRTLTGKIAAFPVFFITPGFDLTFLGTRAEIYDLQAALLATNLIDLEILRTDGNTLSIKGKFSCTRCDVSEVRDRRETHLRLSVSLVSDGSAITKQDGTKFKVSYGSTTLSEAYYGQIVTVSSAYLDYYNGKVKMTDGKLLVTRDITLTSSPS